MSFVILCSNIFDVICVNHVNETKCDDNVNDSELVLPGYNLLRRDGSRNGGGVALYLKMVLILNAVKICVTLVLNVFGLK